MRSVADLKDLLNGARQELRRRQDGHRDAVAEATRIIDAAHKPGLEEISTRVNQLSRELAEAENAAVKPHAWSGRKVWREEPVYGRWNNRLEGKVRVEGIVEDFKHGTDTGPGSLGHYLQPGDPYVRLLKKDGTPGKKCESFNREDRWGIREGVQWTWALVE